jgi:hypothetical protein
MKPNLNNGQDHVYTGSLLGDRQKWELMTLRQQEGVASKTSALRYLYSGSRPLGANETYVVSLFDSRNIVLDCKGE